MIIGIIILGVFILASLTAPSNDEDNEKYF